MTKKRCRHDLMAQIVMATPKTRTDIYYGIKLAGQQIRYIDEAVRLGLIEAQEGRGTIYRATEKGQHVVRLYRKLERLLGET